MSNACIDISVKRVDAPISLSIIRQGDYLSYSVKRKGANLNIAVSPICSVGLIKDGREVFLVKDGIFLLQEGKTFRVIKENGRLPE